VRGRCVLLASLREQLRAPRKAEARIIIARLPSTIKIEGKRNSCQLAKNTPPLCVIVNVIVSSRERFARRSCLARAQIENEQMGYAVHEVIMPKEHKLHFRWKLASSRQK